MVAGDGVDAEAELVGVSVEEEVSALGGGVGLGLGVSLRGQAMLGMWEDSVLGCVRSYGESIREARTLI